MGGLGSDLLERFQQAASELDGLDRAAYTEAKRDQNEPIFGLGPANASIAFFGRDPGREEIKHGVPFIGAGGQQIRRVLHQRARHSALATTEQAIAAGIGFFGRTQCRINPLAIKRGQWQ
jgi:Uracil DNA glycosylase superfamily.